MGVMIGCEKVLVDFPTKTVFRELTLGIDDGARIGIVGPNGSGKSTLLSVLSRQLEPDDGRVVHTRGITVGVLGQSDDLSDDDSVHHAVVGDAPEYEWAASARTREILESLLGDIPWETPVGTLSGGQRRRVDLARLLMGDWDVLMLDEPTNHLDIAAISWLARHLKSRWHAGQGVLLVVTHDRWFLDEVALNMWEVHDGGVEPFEGGFSAYIMQRVERERAAAIAEQKRQNQLRRELAWLSRGARARATKPKFHVKAAQELIADVPELRNEIELKRMAMSRLGKQCVGLTNVTVAYADRTESAQTSIDGSSQEPALDESSSATEKGPLSCKANGTPTQKPVLNKVNWLIGPGDRYGIVGGNGAGKTTLLNVITGALAPTSGFVKIGKTVKFAVLSQNLDNLVAFGNDRVRQVIGRYNRRTMLDGKEMTPAQLLEGLGFTNADLNEPVSSLSGGQKRRLALMLILLDEPNVLILDEPGNDLDVDMLAQVETMLDGWPGTLLLVTHDRYLMERVTDDQFALINGTIRHLPGGIDEYLRIAAALPRPDSQSFHEWTNKASKLSEDDVDILAELGFAAPEPETPEMAQPEEPKLTGGEIRRLRKLMTSNEGKVETLKGKIAAKQQELAEADQTDYLALTAIQDEIAAFQDRIDELELEWLEAAEQLGE